MTKTRTNELAVTGNRRTFERKTEEQMRAMWGELQARNRAAGPWGVRVTCFDRVEVA
jgi:hypothetical protein